MIFEGPEEFNLRIIIPQEAADIGVGPGMPIESRVGILDDEGMYACAHILKECAIMLYIYCSLHCAATAMHVLPHAYMGF